MGRLRWGDEAPSDAEEARARIVAAAESCMDRLGLAKTTVEDVAAEARVSRATVYRYFATRDDLVLAVLLGVLNRSIDRGLGEFLDGADTAEALRFGLVESAAYLLDAIRATPKLHTLLATDVAGVTATIAGASRALFEGYAAELRPHLERARRIGALDDRADLDELAEWVLRAILSLLTVEGPIERSHDDERAMLHRFLGPAIAGPAPG